ncbi:phosphotransferase enzyme family protein [Devosia sp. CN2-171]|uniref:phosphotransferase enzyme family protein n=1 Tax=Devosia sp. CN2-171 TaxID=3400909 RepID=UPI003BF92700
MLKLRHLFDNRALAETLAAEWVPDPEPFPWYRISSNAIYVFLRGGEPHFLRFAPQAEKDPQSVAAELAFIAYLRDRGFGAPEAISSRSGEQMVVSETEWGPFVATAFRRVPGQQLGRTGLADEIVAAHGRALAELHTLSRDYAPPGTQRWSHVEALDWMAPWFETDAARAEAKLVAGALAALPRDADAYGLCHYDLECDNVFFDAASGRCHAIDFDDAMYHWFAMDIEQAVASVREEIDPERADAGEAAFLAGYASARPLPPDLDRARGICRRFADLYWYARVRRSLAETFADEPYWMVDLRSRLAEGLAEREARFGAPNG